MIDFIINNPLVLTYFGCLLAAVALSYAAVTWSE